jgi:hypothetical protein
MSNYSTNIQAVSSNTMNRNNKRNTRKNNNNKSFVNEMRKLRLIFINSFKNEVKRYYH